MHRVKITKDIISQTIKYVYVVRESIGWFVKTDFYAVRLPCGDCSVGVIGRKGIIEDLIQVFSSKDPLPVLGPVRRWDCLKKAHALGHVDIFLGEIPPWAGDKRGKGEFVHQPLIEQHINLADGLDAFLAAIDCNHRTLLMRSIAEGDTVALGHVTEEIENFYNNFLLPSSISRQGRLAALPPLQVLLDLATDNCLLHIKDSAGVIQFTAFILKRKNREWRLLQIAINPKSTIDKRRELILLARGYVEAAKYAIACGQKSLSLGLSPAAAGNGIFRFKADFNGYYNNNFLAYPRLQGKTQTALGVEKLTALHFLVRPENDPSKIMPFGQIKAVGLASSQNSDASAESNSRVVNTFFQMGLASAVTSVMGVALKIALPRVLGPTQMGQIYFAESMAAIFFGFMPLGVAFYIAREVPKNPGISRIVLSTVIPFQLIFAVILGLSMLGFLHFSGADTITQQCGIAFGVYSAAMVLQKSIVGRTYLALGKSGTVAANEIWTRLLLVFIVATTLFWIPNAVNISWCYAIAHVIGLSLLLRKSFNDKFMKWSADFSHFKEIVWTSLPFFAVSALIEIYGNVDIAMLSYFSNAGEVAFYGSANKLKGAALVFLPIFQAAIQPALARTWFNDREKFPSLVSHAMRLLIAMSLPIVIVMVLVPEYIAVTVFGPQFAKSSLAIACMAPIITLSSLNVLMGSCLNVVSNGLSFLAVTMISVFMNAVLNALAISYAVGQFGPGAGAAAAAIATVISETFVLVSMRRIFKVGLDQKRMWLILLAALAPCLLIGLTYQTLQSINPLFRIAAAGILVPIYMFLVKLLRRDDIRWIINIKRTSEGRQIF